MSNSPTEVKDRYARYSAELVHLYYDHASIEEIEGRIKWCEEQAKGPIQTPSYLKNLQRSKEILNEILRKQLKLDLC